MLAVADLNFIASEEFRVDGPSFRLPRGSPSQRLPAPPASAGHLIGMGWLHAERARSCLGRGRLWQAERMIAGVRDQALALACLRHDLATLYGAAVDLLPRDVLAAFAGSVVHAVISECHSAPGRRDHNPTSREVEERSASPRARSRR